jgi:TonB family protein
MCTGSITACRRKARSERMPSHAFQRSLLILLFTAAAVLTAPAQTVERPVRVAVLDFGETQTGRRVAEKLAQAIASHSSQSEFHLIDRDQSRAAALGTGYGASLNMSLEEARNLGAAIGCDFFLTGDAQTLRRSPSDGPIYFESYASIFLVSARTGRLVSWERPSIKSSTPADSEKALLEQIARPDILNSYQVAIRRALHDESAERAHAIENNTPVIEVMADESSETQTGTRPPRPFRRVKPEYTKAAALTEVEAIVDALVDIDEKGEVGRVEIARWAGYGLDQSVIDTVKQMHFFPAMRNGVAIPMRVLLRYNFRK